MPAQEPAPVVIEPVEYKVIAVAPSAWNGAPTKVITDLEKNIIVKVLRGDQPFAPNETAFTNYYTKYKFPLMTQTAPEQLANLHKERMSFLRDHFNHSKKSDEKAKEAHDKLVALTFKSMKAIATDNYHPAVRYNAMLIIGDLNSKESQTSGGQVPAEPLAEARDFLLAEATKPQQLDAVRLAALLGLLRHSEANADRTAEPRWPAPVRAAMVKQITPLAMDKKVGATQTPEGHAWLRGRAVEILAALGRAAPDPAITQTLVQIIGDESDPLSLRLIAADSLGQLNLAAGALNGSDVGRKLADLSLAASKSILARLDAEIADEKLKAKAAGGGGRPPLGGIGPKPPRNPMDPATLKQDQRMELACRQLKDQMMRVTHGLRGSDGTQGAMSAAKAQGQKDYLTSVGKSLGELSKVADVPTPELNPLAKEMRAKISDLERVAKTGGAAPPPAAPAVPTAPEGPGELEAPGAATPAAPMPPAVAAPPALEAPGS